MRRAWATIRRDVQAATRRLDDKTEYIRATIERITVTASLREGCQAADLIIEAIYEDLRAKRKLFAAIDKVCVD